MTLDSILNRLPHTLKCDNSKPLNNESTIFDTLHTFNLHESLSNIPVIDMNNLLTLALLSTQISTSITWNNSARTTTSKPRYPAENCKTWSTPMTTHQITFSSHFPCSLINKTSQIPQLPMQEQESYSATTQQLAQPPTNIFLLFHSPQNKLDYRQVITNQLFNLKKKEKHHRIPLRHPIRKHLKLTHKTT